MTTVQTWRQQAIAATVEATAAPTAIMLLVVIRGIITIITIVIGSNLQTIGFFISYRITEDILDIYIDRLWTKDYVGR